VEKLKLTREDLSRHLEESLVHSLYNLLYRNISDVIKTKKGHLVVRAFYIKEAIKAVEDHKGNYRGSHISRNRELILKKLKEIHGEKEKNQTHT